MTDEPADRNDRGVEGDRPNRDAEDTRAQADEREPIHDDAGERLGDVDDALESHEYPTTSGELVDSYGDREVETRDGWRSIDDVFEPVDDEVYESPDDVRNRIQGLIRRG